MLKKTLACILTSVMLLACAGETSSAAESVVTILGGSSGGLWAIIAEGVGEAMRRSFPR